MASKIDALQNILQTKNLDYACITEHWITDEYKTKVKLTNYQIGSAYYRQNYKHGGVILLAKEKINLFERIDLISLSVELDIENSGNRDSNKENNYSGFLSFSSRKF